MFQANRAAQKRPFPDITSDCTAAPAARKPEGTACAARVCIKEAPPAALRTRPLQPLPALLHFQIIIFLFLVRCAGNQMPQLLPATDATYLSAHVRFMKTQADRLSGCEQALSNLVQPMHARTAAAMASCQLATIRILEALGALHARETARHAAATSAAGKLLLENAEEADCTAKLLLAYAAACAQRTTIAFCACVASALLAAAARAGIGASGFIFRKLPTVRELSPLLDSCTRVWSEAALCTATGPALVALRASAPGDLLQSGAPPALNIAVVHACMPSGEPADFVGPEDVRLLLTTMAGVEVPCEPNIAPHEHRSGAFAVAFSVPSLPDTAVQAFLLSFYVCGVLVGPLRVPIAFDAVAALAPGTQWLRSQTLQLPGRSWLRPQLSVSDDGRTLATTGERYAHSVATVPLFPQAQAGPVWLMPGATITTTISAICFNGNDALWVADASNHRIRLCTLADTPREVLHSVRVRTPGALASHADTLACVHAPRPAPAASDAEASDAESSDDADMQCVISIGRLPETQLRTLRRFNSTVQCIAFSQDGAFLAAGVGACVYIFKLHAPRAAPPSRPGSLVVQLKPLPRARTPVLAIAFAAGADILVVHQRNGPAPAFLCAWQAQACLTKWTPVGLHAHWPCVSGLALTHSSLLLADTDDSVLVLTFAPPAST